MFRNTFICRQCPAVHLPSQASCCCFFVDMTSTTSSQSLTSSESTSNIHQLWRHMWQCVACRYQARSGPGSCVCVCSPSQRAHHHECLWSVALSPSRCLPAVWQRPPIMVMPMHGVVTCAALCTACSIRMSGVLAMSHLRHMFLLLQLPCRCEYVRDSASNVRPVCPCLHMHSHAAAVMPLH